VPDEEALALLRKDREQMGPRRWWCWPWRSPAGTVDAAWVTALAGDGLIHHPCRADERPPVTLDGLVRLALPADWPPPTVALRRLVPGSYEDEETRRWMGAPAEAPRSSRAAGPVDAAAGGQALPGAIGVRAGGSERPVRAGGSITSGGSATPDGSASPNPSQVTPPTLWLQIGSSAESGTVPSWWTGPLDAEAVHAIRSVARQHPAWRLLVDIEAPPVNGEADPSNLRWMGRLPPPLEAPMAAAVHAALPFEVWAPAAVDPRTLSALCGDAMAPVDPCRLRHDAGRVQAVHQALAARTRQQLNALSGSGGGGGGGVATSPVK
jgi:hypothetical protein